MMTVSDSYLKGNLHKWQRTNGSRLSQTLNQQVNMWCWDSPTGDYTIHSYTLVQANVRPRDWGYE